jgi:hypothetical protein
VNDRSLARRFWGSYPAARWIADPQTGVVTVRWTDMRCRRMTVDHRAGAQLLATVRVAPDGAVVSEQLGQ